MKEDESWSSVSSGDLEDHQEAAMLVPDDAKDVESTIGWSTTENSKTSDIEKQIGILQKENAKLRKEKESAIQLLRATLQTETLLDKLDTCTDQDIMETIESLVLGSFQLDLHKLNGKAVQFAHSVMEQEPKFSVAVMATFDKLNQYLNGQGETKTWWSLATVKTMRSVWAELHEETMQNIRSDPTMLQASAALLDDRRMSSMLQDPDIAADELEMFQVLETWSNGPDSTKENYAKALDLVQFIALEKINPVILSTRVRKSDLVTDTMLVDAFAKQAPHAKQNMTFQKRNSSAVEDTSQEPNQPSCVWESSDTDVFRQDSGDYHKDFVQGRILKTGTHTWHYQVEENCRSSCGTYSGNILFFGIALATSKATKKDRWIGGSGGEWSIGTNGRIYHQGSHHKDVSTGMPDVLPPGSVIQLTLTVAELGKPCSLEASFGDGPLIVVANDRDLLYDGCGFVPAASLYGKSAVRFLGFEE